MMIGGETPCAPSPNVIKKFAVQKRYETDDLYILAESSSAAHRLYAQIKLSIAFTEKDENFQKALGAFWADFNNQEIFSTDTDALLLIVSHLTKEEKNHVVTLLDWARTHGKREFFDQVNSVAAKKNRLEIFKNVLETAHGSGISQRALWQFMRCMHVLEYDFDTTNSVDLKFS